MADRVDVIVVGGGVSGLAATGALAEAGVGVRLYDRGSFEGRPGGGIVPGTSLAPLGGPSVRQDVPFDRQVLERRWLLLSEEGDVALDFLDAPSPMPSEGVHTVRNGTLAPWLAARAKTLGADLRPQTPVEKLRRDGRGRISGVIVLGEEIEAKVTILADSGVLRTSPEVPVPTPTVAVAESHWKLSEGAVTARFGGKPGYGSVYELLLGPLDPSGPAGGYILPFRDSVAVGVVASYRAGHPGADLDLLQRLEAHPSVAHLVKGGTRERPIQIQLGDRPDPGRPLSGAGFLAAGTAGGLMAASGTRFRAVDAAIRSGLIVAGAARDAALDRDPSALRMGAYRLQLRSEGLLDELRRARASGQRYRAAAGVAQDVPRFLNALMHELFSESGGPKRRVLPTVRAVRRKERLRRRTLARTALVAGRWV